MPIAKNNPRSKDKAQEKRRLRMHLSKTKWLELAPYFLDNQVKLLDFENKQPKKNTLLLDSSLLSNTQRSIYQVRRSSKLATELVGDVDVWVEKKLEQLERFKEVNKLDWKRIETEISKLEQGKKANLETIIDLLEIELVCFNQLPINWPKLFSKDVPGWQKVLRKYLNDHRKSMESRALASIYLGFHDLNQNKNSSAELKKHKFPQIIQDCYKRGRTTKLSKMSVVAALVAKSCDSKVSLGKIEKIEKLAFLSETFPISLDQIRRLMHRGLNPDEVHNFLKQLPRLEASFELLMPFKILFYTSGKKMVQKNQAIEAAHTKAKEKCKAIIYEWLLTSSSSNGPNQMASFIDSFIALNTSNIDNLKEIRDSLLTGRTLDFELRTDWLEILRSNIKNIWNIDREKKKNVALLYKMRGRGNRTLLEYIAKVLAITEDKNLTDKVAKYWLQSELIFLGVDDLELIKVIVAHAEILEVDKAYFYQHFVSLHKKCQNNPRAMKQLSKLFDILAAIDKGNREHVFGHITEALDIENRATNISDTFLETFPKFIQATIEDNAQDCPCWAIYSGAVQICQSEASNKNELLDSFLFFYKKNQPLTYSQNRVLNEVLHLSLLTTSLYESERMSQDYLEAKRIKPDSSKFMLNYLNGYALKPMTDSQSFDFRREGIDCLKRYPAIALLLIDKVENHPKKSIEILENLGIVTRFDTARKTGLKDLERFNEIAVTPKSTKTMVAKGWKTIIDYVPEIKPLVLSFIASRSITGEEQSPPPSLEKTLELKEKLIEEREFLEANLAKQPHKARVIEIRLKNLDKRIANQKEIEENIAATLRKQIIQISKQAEFEALEKVMQNAYKYQLKLITGLEVENINYDSYLRNAILMTQDVDENKRLLKRLIKAAVSGDDNWRHKIPANKAFLENLESAGVNSKLWLESHPENFVTQFVPGKKVHIKLEHEPLKILEMGNYFDTCLSFGGFNSFSTVTNASDLNKRVLYAYDHNGNVVGRKLIAINKKGKLVGFRTYTSVETKAGRIEMRKLIQSYVKAFAQRCNLKLDNRGKVEPLSTKHWYDDGIVKWSSDPQKLLPSQERVARKCAKA